MSLALTTIAGLIIALLGLIGLWRDVQRGFLSLAGTLLGVVLVQIWSAPLASWLQKTFSWTQSTTSWAASSLLFLLVVLFVGYGSGSFIPKPKPPVKDDLLKPPRPKVLSRPAGALLGALNGALITSVLLLYAQEWRANETLQGAISDSYILTMLIDWFSWFILGVAVVIGIQACAKWLFGILVLIGRLGAARQQPPPSKTGQTVQPGQTISVAKTTPVTKTAPTSQTAPVAPVAPVAQKSSGPSLTAEEKKIEAQNEAAHQAGLLRAYDKVSQAVSKTSPDK